VYVLTADRIGICVYERL